MPRQADNPRTMIHACDNARTHARTHAREIDSYVCVAAGSRNPTRMCVIWDGVFCRGGGCCSIDHAGCIKGFFLVRDDMNARA
jgi:hypothetical protein